MIIVYFTYYDSENEYHDTRRSGLPSKFNELSEALKFIETMNKSYRVIRVEIEYTK